MVSGGSALVGIDMPSEATPQDIKVSLGSTDISASFTSMGNKLVGLVSNLQVGDNTLSATLRGGIATTVVLKNHDRNGPIISGPQQTPWICQTDAYTLPDGSTLGLAQDVNCNAPTKVFYVYKSTNGQLLPLASPTTLPADLATTTLDGKTVKYIVRMEVGTLNRGIYHFAIPYDPTVDSAPSPTASYKNWNGKLIFMFGGSAAAGYAQGSSILDGLTPNLLEDEMLSRGYAVISSTLNVFGNYANDVVSAETASMVKEKFIKTYGAPTYTMGWGVSGGSMQQHLIANNYPGILDGITPQIAFADLHSVLPTAMDCSLLDKAFSSGAAAWTDDQKTAVAGYNTWATCQQWMSFYAPDWLQSKATNKPVTSFGAVMIDQNNCPASVPRSLTYDPVSNPEGARCDIYSANKNLVGIDPTTGYAARAYDNVGVQYGLKTLQSGVISPEQFVVLNEQAGGFDNDGNFQASRTVASSLALNNIYEFGRINEAGNLGSIPIIDFRSDPGTSANVHDSIRSLATRARLVRANGNADNQVILRYGGAAAADANAFVLVKMDQWLMNIRNDSRSYASASAKVVANKPADLTDACIPAADQVIAEKPDANNSSQCGQVMPYYSDPRQIAGAPLANDVLKCQLRPLDRSAYPNLSDAQFGRLGAVFPQGVCDYSQPSVSMKALKGTWLSYPSPGVANSLN
jgi:hypothetical protein